MNVFEDLIDELKSENLLEDTVIDLSPDDAPVLVRSQSTDGRRPRLSPDGVEAAEPGFQIDDPQFEEPPSDPDFFRKRAMEEVAGLQMVEHVFAGVEREHMKVPPSAYDDLGAKKALHKFLQVSGDPRSPEHLEAESALRQETEAWNFALYERDHKVSVADLRRFCETSRPVLSSQALIALGWFYRNSPYSEDVRGKFDYVATRLFSRDAEDETRQLLFKHDEMIGHINTLYANWSSVALYTSKDDQMDVSLTVTRFDEFKVEIENADTFDELLDSDFFGRVRAFKEESAEMFFVPDVLAAAIKCNLAIGNRYVELIGRLRDSQSVENIEAKYGEVYDPIVSNAAGRNLVLADVLTLEIETVRREEPVPSVARGPQPVLRPRSVERESPSLDVFGINKWLMAFCLVFILAGAGVYIWAEKVASGPGDDVAARSVSVDDPELAKFVRDPRLTGETLFAVVEPSFETLTADERKAVLSRLLEFAQTQSLQQVNLLNPKGRAVAYASKERIELIAN